uniref:Cadherin N-terminal domain-containing protein n=1 Tax=Amphilophus citrinellus TaxID=61819 RepID=A0A3Q0S8Z6_AMPCI
MTTCQAQTTWIVYILVLVPIWRNASGQFRYSISEEVKEGTLVGNIAKDLGLDKTTLKERGYRIVSIPGSHANTLVLPDRRRTPEEVIKFSECYIEEFGLIQIISWLHFYYTS